MEQIIHDKCGLPVELCECPDAEVRYCPDHDRFVKWPKIPIIRECPICEYQFQSLMPVVPDGLVTVQIKCQSCGWMREFRKPKEGE